MTGYLLECYWVGITEAAARSALEGLDAGSATARASFLLATEEVLFVFVDAPSRRSALEAARGAGLPVDRASRVVELSRSSSR